MLPIDSSWTLFLDRDGVINRRLPDDYVRLWETFEFLGGVLEILPFLAGRFGRIVVVSNQQGIGKGLMSETELAAVHRKMLEEVRFHGGRIDGVYFCPDLASQEPNCRKPSPAMAIQAKNDFPEIDFRRSVMVGDSLSDMQFGSRLGMVNVLIRTKEEEADAIEQALTGDPRLIIHYQTESLRQWATQTLLP